MNVSRFSNANDNKKNYRPYPSLLTLRWPTRVKTTDPVLFTCLSFVNPAYCQGPIHGTTRGLPGSPEGWEAGSLPLAARSSPAVFFTSTSMKAVLQDTCKLPSTFVPLFFFSLPSRFAMRKKIWYSFKLWFFLELLLAFNHFNFVAIRMKH